MTRLGNFLIFLVCFLYISTYLIYSWTQRTYQWSLHHNLNVVWCILGSFQTAFSASTIKLVDWHDRVPPSASHSSIWNPQQMFGVNCVHWLPPWPTSQEQSLSGDDPNVTLDLFTSHTLDKTCLGHLFQHLMYICIFLLQWGNLEILDCPCIPFLSHKFSFKHFSWQSPIVIFF